jgi:DNA-directed RNA polymerase I, II, and III subunit RPABC5
MPFPVRCFSCGKVLGNLETKTETLLGEDKTFAEIFKQLKIDRYCCRRIVMSHVDLNEIVLKYSDLPREDQKVSS